MISDRSGFAAVGRQQRWKNQLLDLTFRNPLLNFVPRNRFPLAVPGNALDQLVELLEDGKKFRLSPDPSLATGRGTNKEAAYSKNDPDRLDDLTYSKKLSVPMDADKVASKLRRLQRSAQLEAQEIGANNLFLALGTLVWELNNTSYVSPLILVPVNLVSMRGDKFSVQMDETSYTQVNLCLIEKLSAEFNVDAKKFRSTGNLDGEQSIRRFLAVFEDAMLQSGATFKVNRSVDLAILQFAKFRMWKDIEDHWSVFSGNRVIQHLVSGNQGTLANPLIPVRAGSRGTLDVLSDSCPLPADATQLTAINKAVHGHSFILEGPPGTGKSQTIANMIASSVATGKKVLFVAEKKAALEVVKQRLGAVGLEEHVLDLHDKDSRITNVRRQIRVALQRKGQGLEGIDHDLAAELGVVRNQLTNYTENLHRENPFGLSLYSAWTQNLAVSGSDVFQAVSQRTGKEWIRKEFVQNATSRSAHEVREKLEKLRKLTSTARPSLKHPWRFMETLPPPGVVQEVVEAGTCFTKMLEKIRSEDHAELTIAIAEGFIDPSKYEALTTLLDAKLSTVVLDELSTPEWRTRAANLVENFKFLVNAQTPVGRVFTNEILTLDIEDLAVRAEEAARRVFLSFGRKKRIHQVVMALGTAWMGLPKDEVNLPVALRMIQSLVAKQKDLQQQIELLSALSLGDQVVSVDSQGLERISLRIAELKHQGEVWRGVKRSVSQELVREVEYLLDSGESQATIAHSIHEYIKSRRALLDLLPRELEHGLATQKSISMAEYWTDTGWPRRLNEHAESDVKAWVEFQTLARSLSATLSDDAIGQLVSGVRTAEDFLRDFDSDFMNLMVQERLEATRLDAFDAKNHEQRVRSYVQLSKKKREQVRLEIPASIIQRRDAYKAQSPASLKDLREAIKPAGPRARELMTGFFEPILKVTPCVLASPDSVARYIPVKPNMFDIVIFDEASQIRVSDSLGAMGRARSVIVVGDSQQMPPTAAFASASAGDNQLDRDEVPADEESILQECESAGIERVWLSGHYRSQTEALIAFSNQHFYDNRLVTFPAPRRRIEGKEEAGYGIHLVRVDGHFYRSSESDIPSHLKRTNPIEAQRIVKFVEEQFKASPLVVPSLGVITFNVQQRDLIEDLIRQSENYRLEEALESEDGLFVKNLENVQGDERDTILFSTAFSPNEHGVLPLNFGPLNNVGGERRLNVAVTRARKAVIVFSSFDPEQLRAHETESLGIKRLRDYLDLAHKGVKALERSRSAVHRLDRHRESIAQALRKRGLHVETAVGLSEFKIDLVVATEREPGVPLLAVMLDGQDWAARPTVGDREMLPQEVLEKVLKWPSTMRVWLPEWIENPAEVCNKIRTQVYSAERTSRLVNPLGVCRS